jgi:hypothetical protein
MKLKRSEVVNIIGSAIAEAVLGLIVTAIRNNIKNNNCGNAERTKNHE